MNEYIGEIIGAIAVILAAVIGLFARKGYRNNQTIKKSDNSTIYQANGSITINGKQDKKK
jgi:hypothetical protein